MIPAASKTSATDSLLMKATATPPDAVQDLLEHVFTRSASATLTSSNQITILLDSRENFPAWLDAIQHAQHSVCIEMYIFASDAFGQQVRAALLERLQHGVEVLVVYDWLGSLGAHVKRFFKPLIAAGARIHPYNKPNLASGLGLFSRNHRKSFVIDQKIAFVSGLCISAQWQGNQADTVSPWRDTGLMLQGPIVEDVFKAFLDTWQTMGLTPPASLLPSQSNERSSTKANPDTNNLLANARLVATTADNANMMRLDLLAVSMARKTLWLTDAYFMPTRMYVQALINAAKDGVDVRILVPSTSDIKWVGAVSRTKYRNLLEAGVRVFEWNGAMIHAKMAVVDGVWARVGSTNLNFSSWFANRELDVAIEDPDIVDYLEACYLDDLQNSTEVVLNEKRRTELKAKRSKPPRPSSLKSGLNRSQRQKALHKVAQFGTTLDNMFYGSRVIDQSEAWAYMSIGLVILALAVLLYFVPQLLTIPVIVLLFIGGATTTVQAIKGLYQLRQRQHTHNKHTP